LWYLQRVEGLDSNLKLEEIMSSETSVSTYQSRRHDIQEDFNPLKTKRRLLYLKT